MDSEQAVMSSPYILFGAMVLAFIAGWTAHTWYDGYKTKNEAIVEEKKAAKGETQIIHDTQTITKVVYREKDNCTQEPVPADILKQLH